LPSQVGQALRNEEPNAGRSSLSFVPNLPVRAQIWIESISKPGMMPAMKSSPIFTCAEMPMTLIAINGE
jgi:hypothetical protein